MIDEDDCGTIGGMKIVVFVTPFTFDSGKIFWKMLSWDPTCVIFSFILFIMSNLINN
jgi:hypothetical protein